MMLSKAIVPLYVVAALSGLSLSSLAVNIADELMTPHLLTNVRMVLHKDGTVDYSRTINPRAFKDRSVVYARYTMTIKPADDGPAKCLHSSIRPYRPGEAEIRPRTMAEIVGGAGLCPETYEAGDVMISRWDPLDIPFAPTTVISVVKD